MNRRLRLLVIVGTRPEAIKMAPVIQRLRAEPERFEVLLCATAQHREMLDQVLGLFALVPDMDLDLMRHNQTASELAARIFARLDPLLAERRPDWLLVQGDTTTAMCAAVAAFYRRIPVGHVEAGLRTGDLEQPFPEEMNRRVIDIVARAFFAPTERAAAALRAEGVPSDAIHLTGNTVVDALKQLAELEGPEPEEDVVLITAHRRESFGEPLERVLRAISRLAGAFPATRFLHVAHPNPSVASAIGRVDTPANVERVEPLDYRSLLKVLRRCRLVLTDSGGLQEEAPTFGKPVLVLRERTERPEGIEAGIALLVGTDEDSIVREASRLLSDESARRAMAAAHNPYGDGKAADRIADVLAGRPFRSFTARAVHAAPV